MQEKIYFISIFKSIFDELNGKLLFQALKCKNNEIFTTKLKCIQNNKWERIET